MKDSSAEYWVTTPVAGASALAGSEGADQQEQLADLIVRHRSGLLAAVRRRLGPQLAARFDPSDIVQQACLEAVQRTRRGMAPKERPWRGWIRLLAVQCIQTLHRRHVRARRRSVQCEQSPSVSRRGHEFAAGEAGSGAPDALPSNRTSPSEAVGRNELAELVRQAVAGLPELDREILQLRHFEQLSNKEVAAALGITEPAASRRYVRALERLRGVLATPHSAVEVEMHP